MEVILLNGGINNESRGYWYQRNIGPYKIAHWLRKHGYGVQVIDHIEKLDESLMYTVIKKFISSDTLVIGLSSTFLASTSHRWKDGTKRWLPEHVLKVLSILKKENPTVKFVVGGYQADKCESPVFDASIMTYEGSTEDVFLEYVEHLKTGAPKPFGKIVMSRFREGQHRTHYDSARNLKYNIENDDFKWTLQDAVLPGEPLPLDLSKGCIFACRFCQYPFIGKKKLDYIRNMEFVEQELLFNYENFGTTNYYLLDDTFNDTEVKLQAFYDMTQRLPFKINYSAFIRADLVHRFPNTAYLLKESGIFGAFHGIESLDPKGSMIIGKGWGGKHARDWIPKLYHDIWNKEVTQHLAFITGLTGETVESVKSTADWFIQNDLHYASFNELGLYGPDTNKSLRGLSSEFDRNSEKYGYEFIPGGTPMSANWKNDLWTRDSARQVAKEQQLKVWPYNKQSSWGAQFQLWYGFSKEYTMNTPLVNMPDTQIKITTIGKFKEYFKLLTGTDMTLKYEAGVLKQA